MSGLPVGTERRNPRLQTSRKWPRNAWLAYPAFRDYVLALFADRIGDLMQRVEEVALHRLDARLAAALLGHGRLVHTTPCAAG